MIHRFRILALSAGVLVAIGLIGCSTFAPMAPSPPFAGTPSQPTASPATIAPTATAVAKLRVVATTTQVNALAQVVGGDRIQLAGILKANVDPHEYEATPDDVRSFAKAQVIFENGVGLEKWLDKVIGNSGTHARVVDTSNGVKLRKGVGDEPLGDPHIWLAVPNGVIMLNNIRDALMQGDPANADYFKSNAATYEKNLNDLDGYITQQIAAIPAANRKFVTNHDAFGYYVERYKLTFVGSIIPGMDTNFQPSAKELGDLVKAIKTQRVKAIFSEASINPALAQQIAKEAGVKVVDGRLYGDTLGPPGSGADTLDGMLKFNTDLIVSALK